MPQSDSINQSVRRTFNTVLPALRDRRASHLHLRRTLMDSANRSHNQRVGLCAPAIAFLATAVFTLVFIANVASANAEPDAGEWSGLDWSQPFAGAAPEPSESLVGSAGPRPYQDRAPASGPIQFGTIDGAPGAEVTPQGSPLTFGIGLKPRETITNDPLAGRRPVEDNDPFADIGNGFSGALSVSETNNGVTQSMSVVSPLTDGLNGESGNEAASDEIRTMFGLGVNW